MKCLFKKFLNIYSFDEIFTVDSRVLFLNTNKQIINFFKEYMIYINTKNIRVLN